MSNLFQNITPQLMKQHLKLYLVMGSVNCKKDPVEVLSEAIEGGITIFQYREKGDGALEGYEKLQLGKKLQSFCKQNNIPFIVNDDINLALELDADGIHIGQEDGNISEIRKLVGNKILGVSTHNLAEAKEAVNLGTNYIGVGPMYETKTKLDASEVTGPNMIRHLRQNSINIPIVGIGGINQTNLKPVITAGADGVAVISAISASSQPRAVVNKLIETIDESFPNK
ncbi:thiamine phosphate synthase [Chengkuizengella axinellae]|uniref:Thiamine-phosphate synthase n=1 Tax=Chengkuizengella axinellae TaxID=3064388 RepID=A0ABT9IZF1_9BACL|nr:thiamine phosphate synthase [Chengkuizengella sp. 2205SS18-9]MDP5274750.1 thiamine phosphate synthase [Chengkuizengella sp. 2205SS18-9]